MPVDEDIDMLETKPERVRAKAYDIVLNGYEIGGGSIRIYDNELQRMFKALGFSEEEAYEDSDSCWMPSDMEHHLTWWNGLWTRQAGYDYGKL